MQQTYAGLFCIRKGQLQMFKKISGLFLAIALLLSVPACSMPDAIFSDGMGSQTDEDASREAAEIYSFSFTLGELQLELPTKFSVMSSRGWKISEAAENADEDSPAPANNTKIYTSDSTLEAGEYSDYLPLAKDNSVITAKFYNDGSRQKGITDCLVVGIGLDAEFENEPEFILHKDNLSIGVGYDEVIDACGKPSYIEKTLKSTGELVAINDVKLMETDEDTVNTLYYKLTDHSFIAFKIDTVNSSSNRIASITIENDTELYKLYDYSKELKYKPDNIDLYKGPNLLGKQFTDFAYKFEGNLYTLPLPVRKLLDDGWVFVREYGERIPMGTTVDGLIMRKGNLAMKMMVHNYDTKYAHTAVNCYVISMEAALTGPNASILLSKGITLGSTEKDLVDALGKDYAKKHPVVDEEGNYLASSGNDKYDIPDMPDCYIQKTVGEEFTVYSCVMPDDVPTITLPVSITDIGDIGSELLGETRKHIDVYVSNDTHLIYRFYLQNCPEYVVDEAKIIEEQLEAQREKEREEWKKQQEEKEKNNG